MTSIVVVHGDSLSSTPPVGYSGLARIAWGAALELAGLGVEVRLYAPHLLDDPQVYRTLASAREGWPTPADVAGADALYVIDSNAMHFSQAAARSFSRGPVVIEENAPWTYPQTQPNLYHVVYRADRLRLYPPGHAWLCDQVLPSDEVGPPAPPQGYVLWMGRIHHEKGVESLITFARALPGLPILVAGPEQTRCHAWPPNIRLIGEVTGIAKRALLAGADALLYTVSPWWIGAGEGVLAEAAACGVPILAQNFVRGTPATRCVIDGFNGFLHHDVGALARLYPHVLSMDRLALHRHAWARMAPRRVAEDRLERMQRVIGEMRGGG